MTNLLKETMYDIENSGHTIDDIKHIGNKEYGCSWEEFKVLADVEYDDGFGAAEVAVDLTILFTDGTSMCHHEYDGSESWKYSVPWEPGENPKKINKLVGGYWLDLDSLNKEYIND